MDGLSMSARPSAGFRAASSGSVDIAPDFPRGFSPQDQSQSQSQNQDQDHSPTPPPQHRRGYQACDPCRKRKVKCDLGSVDNPRPPPCVRCRRESKRCEFSATRRKRKAMEEAEESKDEVLRRDKRMMSADPTLVDQERAESNDDTHTITNGVPSTFKPEPRASTSSLWDANTPQQQPQPPPQPHAKRISVASIAQSYAPTSVPVDQYRQHQSQNQSQNQPQNFTRTRPTLGSHLDGHQGGGHVMNRTAADLLSPAISNTHDALHLLSEAAGRTEDLNRQQMEYRYGASNHASTATLTSSGSPMGTGMTPGKLTRSNSSTQQGGSQMGWYDQKSGSTGAIPPVDVQESIPQGPKSPEEMDYEKARRVWARLRFIRAGWFSVDEAMAYITYYFENLAPLSPIVLPDFTHPTQHLSMLTEEPVLTVALLTIASRHMKLTGNGARSRAYSIHEKLWSYLKGMIERLFWGQEKFANGSVPAGFSKPRQFTLSNPPSSGQAFGGHLRSLGTVEALLLLTDWHPRALHFPPGDDENTLLDTDPQLPHSTASHDDRIHSGNSEGRLAFYKWLEPVWRSDRMSWMLLSTGQALAFELGIFDHKTDLKSSTESPSEQARKRRVRRLILVYTSQSSGRLGIPSMLPLPQWNQNTDPSYPDGPALRPEDYAIDMMQDCWMDISKIMHVTNQELFPSKEETSNLIKSGRYRERIDEFMPSLRAFKKKFTGLAGSMTPHMRYILTIEYEYTRLHVNCLALQAVVDRWTNMPNEAGGSDGAPSLRVLMEQYEVNEPYIREVVDASRKILQIVLDGLVPGDYLRHTPVRTFFRIMSGMIFILKTFTLGAKEDDVRVSLELQDRTIEALRDCVVDDVHLGVTIADLLQLLTENIRTRFLRFSDRADADPSRERTPIPLSSPHAHSQHDGTGTADYQRWQNQGQTQSQTPMQNVNLTAASASSTFNFDGSNPSSSTPATSQDPLANIPAQPIGSAAHLNNIAFMPPPPSVYFNYYEGSGGGSTGTSPKMQSSQTAHLDDGNTNPNNNNNNNDSTVAPHAITNDANGHHGGAPASGDWFALPLDHFFVGGSAGVDQGIGGTGPMVGEFDMLEVLLKEQYTGGGNDGGAGGVL